MISIPHRQPPPEAHQPDVFPPTAVKVERSSVYTYFKDPKGIQLLRDPRLNARMGPGKRDYHGKIVSVSLPTYLDIFIRVPGPLEAVVALLCHRAVAVQFSAPEPHHPTALDRRVRDRSPNFRWSDLKIQLVTDLDG